MIEFWREEIKREPENAIARIQQLEEELLWIAEFADVRSRDDSKTFARVSRAALRTIRCRARAQANGAWVRA